MRDAGRTVAAGLCLGCLAASPAPAADTETVVRGVRFPEGPLWSDGALHFVEYGGHTLLRWADGETVKVWERPGCGPSGLARVGEGFLVACYDENRLVLVTPSGATGSVLATDEAGEPIVGPNDFAADRRGGVYLSASGPWETAPIVGRILHRSADGRLREVADDLHYANGLALSPDGRTLYCSETYGYRIVAFTVDDAGGLTDRREFARVSAIAGRPSAVPMAPDGLKVDAAGNLYIALYEGGEVLVSSPGGELLATVDPPAGNVSNVAFGADEGELFVTGVLDARTAPWPGEVYRVRNPVRP